jgi:hypothetical protein
MEKVSHYVEIDRGLHIAIEVPKFSVCVLLLPHDVDLIDLVLPQVDIPAEDIGVPVEGLPFVLVTSATFSS